MEFSSAEADYQEAAKKEVAVMLTVSVLESLAGIVVSRTDCNFSGH